MFLFEQLYVAADMTEEKVRLLRSMGQSINPEIIKNTLKFIFESVNLRFCGFRNQFFCCCCDIQDDVRMQDSISGLVGCTSSRVGRDLVWQFLQENWKKLVTRFGEKSNFLISFVEVK